jgi:hypothetical protein
MSSVATDPFDKVISRLDEVSESRSGEYTARCPAHDDKNPSLSVARGDQQPVVFNCHAGCTPKEIVSALGLDWGDICEGDLGEEREQFEKAPWEHGEHAQTYTYLDEEGSEVYNVKRYEHPERGWKSFRPYLPGKKRAGLGKQERVLYRLPAVKPHAKNGGVVFIVEGEKDVHTLEDHGFHATTPGSADSWQDRFAKQLAGGKVVVIPDSDEAGGELARDAAKSCFPVADWVRVLRLDDVPAGGDITDWFARGHTKEELSELVQETDNWNPDMAPTANGQAPTGSNTRPFWYVDESEEKVKIDRGRFIQFLEDHGFGKTYVESDLDSRLVRVQDNVVQYTSVERIKDFTLRFVREEINDEQGLPLPASGSRSRAHAGYGAEDVADALLRGSNVYFSSGLFEFLEPLDLNFHRDTAEKAFFYFQNGFVEVTAEGFTLHDHSDLDGVIWKDQIIGREFTDLTDEETSGWDWHEHLLNVAGRNSERHTSLCTALGYLQHGYKDPAVTKAVIFMDEKDTEVEDGRTGKSLTAKALQETCPTLRIDGRNFSFDSQFAFQQAEVGTQIIDFNDVRERFPFERLFSVITDDFPIERKNQDRVTIDFEDSPKFLLSTNYVIEGRGASFEDRTFQVEFSDYYGPDHTPVDEFGHRLFDDWGEEEWAQFDNVMMACVRLYLRDGLTPYDHVNVDYRRLKQQTCPDFAEWVVDFVEPGKEYEKEALWRTFREAYSPDYEDLKKSKFGHWMNDFARVYELNKQQQRKRSDGTRKRYVTFRSKG